MTTRWPYDTSEPRITPQAIIDVVCERNGVTPADIALPPTLLGTFQHRSEERLRARTAAVPPAIVQSRPGLALGMTNSGKTLCGRTPRTGAQVAVATFPIGAPATAMFLEFAIARGVRNLLICGSAGSLRPDLPIGRTVVVDRAEREDGTSHHYLPAEDIVAADPELTTKLEGASRAIGAHPVRGRSWTIDAPFRETVDAIARHQANGVSVVDMEAAAIFAVARVRGIRAAIVVAVSDEVFRPWAPGFTSPAFHEGLDNAVDAVIAVAEDL
ncbi:MAG TPA: nucleoside phosphorylase [Methylomirabilota bacterium]|nr:nucleoside phosphorylase [Methylomirabilota bacterium]